MAETSATTEMWVTRVQAWRKSSERAEVFSRGEGYAASTLRWWASKLERDLAAASPPRYPPPEVRLARVVRRATVSAETLSSEHPITLELAHVGVRLGVTPGADRATLMMVLDVLGVGRQFRRARRSWRSRSACSVDSTVRS